MGTGNMRGGGGVIEVVRIQNSDRKVRKPN